MLARLSLLRVMLSMLAVAHMYPARKHLALFWAEPSLGEAWKGLGALLAIAFFCIPFAWYARSLRALVRRRATIFALSAVLVAAHLVPAADHLPAFFAHPSWADGWRGFGSALAAAWFLSSRALRGRIVRALARTTTVTPAAPTAMRRQFTAATGAAFTGIGTSCASVEPSPSCPDAFAPQHLTSPSPIRAQPLSPPTTSSATPINPCTGTGLELGFDVPFTS